MNEVDDSLPEFPHAGGGGSRCVNGDKMPGNADAATATVGHLLIRGHPVFSCASRPLGQVNLLPRQPMTTKASWPAVRTNPASTQLTGDRAFRRRRCVPFLTPVANRRVHPTIHRSPCALAIDRFHSPLYRRLNAGDRCAPRMDSVDVTCDVTPAAVAVVARR
jgi:hypothetical protein